MSKSFALKLSPATLEELTAELRAMGQAGEKVLRLLGNSEPAPDPSDDAPRHSKLWLDQRRTAEFRLTAALIPGIAGEHWVWNGLPPLSGYWLDPNPNSPFGFDPIRIEVTLTRYGQPFGRERA